jgi:RNA polymerase sigma factor (sigma-70 family)
MALFPETNVSLILRLPRNVDSGDWMEFSDIYQPLIYRFGRRRGLTEQDAQDLVQRVMMAVVKSIDRWRPDPNLPKFRNWLFTIARNQLINLVNAHKPDAASGGSDHMNRLHQTVDRRTLVESENDYHREVLLWAAARVRAQIHEQTWSAFWKTSVEGMECDVVARQLKMSLGGVYAARSRVMSRLKVEVAKFEDPSS